MRDLAKRWVFDRKRRFDNIWKQIYWSLIKKVQFFTVQQGLGFALGLSKQNKLVEESTNYKTYLIIIKNFGT